MYARSSSIQARPDSIDTGIAHVRDEVIPALAEMDGYVGLSLLVDRQSGECIATSAWESEFALRFTAELAEGVRQRAADVFAGTATKVDEWNIAVLHRAQRSNHGACVRATWIKVVPDQASRAVDFYRTSVLPEMEELDGFCSASLMIDPTSRRAVSSATFDSFDALERNRDQASALRTAKLREMGAEALDVGEYELAIAELRVPELA